MLLAVFGVDHLPGAVDVTPADRAVIGVQRVGQRVLALGAGAAGEQQDHGEQGEQAADRWHGVDLQCGGGWSGSVGAANVRAGGDGDKAAFQRGRGTTVGQPDHCLQLRAGAPAPGQRCGHGVPVGAVGHIGLRQQVVVKR